MAKKNPTSSPSAAASTGALPKDKSSGKIGRRGGGATADEDAAAAAVAAAQAESQVMASPGGSGEDEPPAVAARSRSRNTKATTAGQMEAQIKQIAALQAEIAQLKVTI